MKTKRLSKSLVDYIDNHADEFWLQYRWKDGKPVCPYCNSLDKQYHCSDGRYKCGHCNKRYSSVVGTAFQNTKLTMKTIVKGIFFLFVTRSASAVMLSSYLNVNNDTAYFFLKRMQMASKQDFKLSGEIAMDEVYMGGKWRNKHYRKKRAILKENAIIPQTQDRFNRKEAALGMDVCKRPVYGGNDKQHIFLEQMPSHFDSNDLKQSFDRHSENVTTCISDDSKLYNDWGTPLEVNSHSKKQYQTKNGLSSNSIEGVFSHLRTFMRAHIHCKEKYLQLYLNWFVFKWNHRKQSYQEMFGALVDCLAKGTCRYKDVLEYDALKKYREREAQIKQNIQKQLQVLKEALQMEVVKYVEWNGRWYTIENINNLVPTDG